MILEHFEKNTTIYQFSWNPFHRINVTHGYELMLCRESAHNIFRLLMCRDVNLHQLKGVIFDHACGLDQYILNREPREFEFLRCLVDGAHWQVSFYKIFTMLYCKVWSKMFAKKNSTIFIYCIR